jgi:hypothetical protein
LSASQLHQRYAISFGDVCDPPQLRRAGDTAGDLGNNREPSVLLNIGMDALVDKARIFFDLIFAFPQSLQQRGQTGFASGVFFSTRKIVENRRHRLQIALENSSNQIWLGERNTRNIVMYGRILLDLSSARPLDDFAHHRFAGPAAHARAGGIHYRFCTAFSGIHAGN